MLNKKEDVKVVVNVDAKLKKRWEEALKTLEEAEEKGAAAWHLKWLTVSVMVESKPALYLAGGFSTDAEFYEAILGDTRQVCTRNMRIAKLATAAEITSYKISKLNLAIAYVEASTKKSLVSRDDVDFAKLRIAFTQSGKKVSKSLKDISYAELSEAVSQLAVRPKKAPASADMKMVLELLKGSGVEGVKATMVGGAFNIRVPIDGLAAVAKALSDFDPADKS